MSEGLRDRQTTLQGEMELEGVGHQPLEVEYIE